jgi:maltose O-acetyltransferase
MTEKEKMQAGEWFSQNDEELVRDRARARHLTHRLNVALKDKDATYLATLRELCPRVEAMIRAPFHCDYGYNISIGKGSYVNFNCVFLDLGPIRLGQRCLIGPGVQLLTAVHPMNAAERATGKEKGAGIEIGDDCWLGGGVIVCPGVKIGCRCVIGAGSVVTHDIPDDSVAAGNPARVIRTATDE